jgi:hypothetical protein
VNIWTKLEQSLAHQHPSLNSGNPVLNLNRAQADTARLQFVLGQYLYLPATIVALLSTTANRLCTWQHTYAELQRNISEELGSRTSGTPHYRILTTALSEELGWKVPLPPIHSATRNFLGSLWARTYKGRVHGVAGMIYALEDSATPELKIVAEIINRFAQASGQKPIIDTAYLQQRPNRRLRRATAKYDLNQFFALHVHDFEKGHQSLLKNALNKDQALKRRDNAQAFERGYERTLDDIDEWWSALATEDIHDHRGVMIDTANKPPLIRL